MKIKSEKLYHEMLTALAKSQQANGPEKVECSFWIASKFWDRLKKSIDKRFFESKANQIYFFRNIKPKFTSQIQYYTILAEVLLSVPDNPSIEVIYWKQELKRYVRFYEKNKAFIAYYESKAVDLDDTYFTRTKPGWDPEYQLVFYDADRKFCSSHDHLIRGLIANRMYNEYVEQRLIELRLAGE